jgi:predicted exporter
MFDKYFLMLYQLVLRQKKRVIGFVVLATIVAGAGLYFIRYEGNIDIMLPPDKEISRSMDFLRDSSLSDKIIISLALTDPGKNKKDLFLAVDRLAAALRPPFFTKVISGFSVVDVMEEFSILRYAPQVLGEQDLASIDSLINKTTVEQKMREIYRQSLRPESIFMSSLSRMDPLGIKVLLLDKLRALPASMGYDVAIEDGHFISRDGRHAMLIIQTTVPMLDSQRSKELIAALQEQLRHLPVFISADVVCGHLHTTSNEQVIKRDIMVASLIASVAFLLLFTIVFRDARALFVFIIPLIAVVWAIVISTLLEGRLSYLVIGFGTAIAGISIDYGLLVYIAMKRGADSSQTTKLARLLIVDAVTTMCSFLVLYFSVIRGYHQLALFSALVVFICLILSLFVLPLTLSWKNYTLVSDPTIGDRMRKVKWPAPVAVGIWAILTAAALALSFSVKFDSDVKKLDGSAPDVLRAEQRFHEVWGGKTNQAIFVVTGTSYEDAMERNDLIFREATKAIGPQNISSIALFWSSLKMRRENSERWDRFWNRGREDKLKKLIRVTSSAYGFSDNAFSPFFAGLHTHPIEASNPEGLIARLQERFVAHKDGEYRIMSFFPDDQHSVDSLAQISREFPGTFIVSGRALSASISKFTSQELKILAPLAILFNVVLAWMFFRNWKETFIALVPVITGIIWLGGIMSLFKMPLNVVNIVAAIITTGVIVDYGLGITYEYRYNLRIGTVIAVTLSAGANVIGSGALLFARHPALYSTGVAMVICMVSGYLSSVIVVPSLCSLLGTSKQEGKQP